MLNAWKDAEVSAWLASPTWNDTRTQRGGAALIDYGVPNGARGRSVVYSTWQRPLKVPAQADQEVVERLVQDGVHRVVTGHQPFGDAPMVIKADCAPFEVISADTAWCTDQAPTYRGDAISEVVVETAEDAPSRVWIHGVRAGGEEYEYSTEDPWVGTATEDGWWVHAKLDEQGKYGLCRAAGNTGSPYAVEYCEREF